MKKAYKFEIARKHTVLFTSESNNLDVLCNISSTNSSTSAKLPDE